MEFSFSRKNMNCIILQFVFTFLLSNEISSFDNKIKIKQDQIELLTTVLKLWPAES